MRNGGADAVGGGAPNSDGVRQILYPPVASLPLSLLGLVPANSLLQVQEDPLQGMRLRAVYGDLNLFPLQSLQFPPSPSGFSILVFGTAPQGGGGGGLDWAVWLDIRKNPQLHID